MKAAISLLTVLLISCMPEDDQAQEKEKNATVGASGQERELVRETTGAFTGCFAGMDTSGVGNQLNCAAGIYKLIHDKYVLHLSLDLPVQLDKCYDFSIDSLNGRKQAELWIFEKGKAGLTNICTDVVVNAPEPLRVLYAHSGKIRVVFSDPEKYYGNPVHRTTVWVKKLVFTDPRTGEKITLENEVFWKVLYTGIPG